MGGNGVIDSRALADGDKHWKWDFGSRKLCIEWGVNLASGLVCRKVCDRVEEAGHMRFDLDEMNMRVREIKFSDEREGYGHWGL